MDFLNGKIKTIYFKYLLAAFGIFWTALSMACPNVYIHGTNPGNPGDGTCYCAHLRVILPAAAI